MKNIIEIASKYEGFLVDIWGVLHESGKPYPKAASHLLELQKNNKHVILVSNAPRRSSKVADFLKSEMGFIKGVHYNEILTSGESFFIKAQEFVKGRVFYIGAPQDKKIIFESQNLTFVEKIEENPDFAIVTSEQEGEDEILTALLSKKIPLYCLNPDLFIKTKDGKLEQCAGAVAKKYAEQEGEVIYFGKPHFLIYEYAFDILQKLKPGILKEKVLGVGDGMETDIAGANAFGIDSALCICGLPSFSLQKDISLQNYLDNFSSKPTYILDSL